ncbi:MAG: hypothetical protein KIG22_01720, partial [Oxalobacter sp.]|nr:hypothetical protein [Oxalobacter sp.]
LRQEIAIAAARMIAEEGTSYDVAKRKAARLLLGNSRITGEILPDNQTIENEVRIYNELFLSDTQPARLRHLRLLAVQLMQRLERFNPYITGAVLNGTGGEHSDIHLQIFADNVKDIEIFLLNEGIEFSVSESPQSPGKRHAIEVIHFLWHDEVIHLTVYDADDIRRPDRFFGPHAQRADLDELRRLINRDARENTDKF